MSPLAIRRVSRRVSARSAALLAVFALSGAIAMHHGFVSTAHMHHDAGMTAAVELCLGVIAASAAAIAIAIGVVGLGRYRPARELTAHGLVLAIQAPDVRTRAGPGLLSLLCVRRR